MRKLTALFVLSLFFFASCSDKTMHAEAVEADEIYAESIFQLDSDWEDQYGVDLKLADLQGKNLVVAMIYTSCKTACPRLTAQMREIEEGLGKYNKDKVRFILVSIDPEVDTPDTMREYLKMNNFTGPQWVFLRSDDNGTREFANVLSVKYKQISPIDFSHSNIISVFSEDGVLTYQKEGLSVDLNDVVEEVNKLL